MSKTELSFMDVFEMYQGLFGGDTDTRQSERADVCGSRPTKRRRTKRDMHILRGHLYSIVQEQRPMTVRQVFYQAVTRGIIPKTEAAYKSVVVRLLTAMRRDRVMPFDWIADETRWMRKPETHSSLAGCLQRMSKYYRRELWAEQDVYVEVWLEKEALAGVLFEVTAEYDVPLMVTRGYPSLSFVAGAAENIEATGKRAFLYYFGDYDPSGMDISRHVEERLSELAPNADITFERVAVTREQIGELNLPTRPTKRTDSRSKNFKGESVEVDAIPPATLRDLARGCVVGHIDPHVLERTQEVEAAERKTLEAITRAI